MIEDRLKKLRDLMEKNEIDAYLVDNADYHSSEYVKDYFKERTFISSFDGSNGIALILKDSSYLWTDGRYFIQAEKDLKDTSITLMKMKEEGVPTLLEFIKENLSSKVIGLNGYTSSYNLVEEIEGLSTVKSKNDLIDEIWTTRPKFTFNNIYSLPLTLTGESTQSKLIRLREKLEEKGATSIFITSLDDNAWLFNLRGSDVKESLLFLSFSYITKNEAHLFLSIDSLNEALKNNLKNHDIILHEYSDVLSFLGNIRDEKILLSKLRTSYGYVKLLENNNEIIDSILPTTLFKSIKNEVEISNDIDIHKADGLAVFRFMKYIKENHNKKEMDEYNLALKLKDLRKMDKRFIEVSFGTIASFKENAAIVHYAPSKDSSKRVEGDGLFLLDSGGQYFGGTTDITRTYALGKISDSMRHHYTLVLKGHIALANLEFEKGTKGYYMDLLARSPLKDEGLDYKHGTGHGIGYMLNVHEGPNAFRDSLESSVEIKEGTITSNEPGFYLEGEYGIRIESEVLCVKKGDKLGFKTITYAPIDLEPIDINLLTKQEKDWLNNYHKEVYNALKDLVDDNELEYLKIVTREI